MLRKLGSEERDNVELYNECNARTLESYWRYMYDVLGLHKVNKDHESDCLKRTYVVVVKLPHVVQHFREN